MKCPVDGAELRMAERQGVEIDYCPQCRGVWLDRGELDKIIEKATPAVELADPDPYREALASGLRRTSEDMPDDPRLLRDRDPDPRRDWEEAEGEPQYDDDGRGKARGKKHRYEKRGSDDKRAGYKKSYRKKKRTSFLKELFDVFD
ncbi:TFIIB-type zinc ribbon-containing protein [Aliiroseovarius crassostreae]|uniref:TFIIB-type zinc ribbon-containing protein n=1 Tax=Aliiroseovarius crassostreae TaxID=154981 RepID=UPI00220E4FC4|nr:zf-TFIIB domain-containing protein [Aliiroseovarius crassostreae]